MFENESFYIFNSLAMFTSELKEKLEICLTVIFHIIMAKKKMCVL